MPTYTYKCASKPEEHNYQHVKRPMADRDLPVEPCRECGAEMKRALEAPFRSPGSWYPGKR